jgi:hypothetical protein
MKIGLRQEAKLAERHFPDDLVILVLTFPAVLAGFVAPVVPKMDFQVWQDPWCVLRTRQNSPVDGFRIPEVDIEVHQGRDGP